MKSFSFTLLLGLGALAGPVFSYAQVPPLISYQGRVTVAGTNFNGMGQFKFALVTPDGVQTLWSNDGSSTGGSAPSTAVTVPVAQGLCQVPLGDTNLPHMTAIPLEAFTNADVRLRIWFNDGSQGWQQLAPDQRLTAAGYAMMAGNVPNGAITSLKLASGAVGSSALAAGAVTSAAIANGAVGASQLASNAITAAQLAKPPQSGSIRSSDLAVDFNQCIFSVTFNPAFNTTPNVTLSLKTDDPNVDQASLAVRNTSATGFVGRWYSSAVLKPLTAASDPRAGAYISLAVVNGKPAMSYISDSYSSGANVLYYVQAGDANGTIWNSYYYPHVLADTNCGTYTSLLVINGNPAICYVNYAKQLRYVRALDANGTTWGAPVIVYTNTTTYVAAAVVNGNPAICYFDAANNNLKYVRATDANGANWGTPVTVDTSGGSECSMAMVSGAPAIAFSGSGLGYVRAADTNGLTWNPSINPGSTGGGHPSLAMVNGAPAIAFHWSGLQYIRATDATGNAWNYPVTVATSQEYAKYISLLVVNGNPAIGYQATTDICAKYVRSVDANGVAWNPPTKADAREHTGAWCSMALVNGQPALSYAVVGDDSVPTGVKFIRGATSVPAFTVNWIALEP